MEKNQRIELNTALCPLIVPDTYSCFNFDAFYSGDDEEDVFCDVDINQEELVSALIDEARKIWSGDDIDHALKPLGLRFVGCGTFHSPKEYNFRTDDIDLYFETTDEYSDEKFFDALRSFKEDKSVVRYLERNYKSCSGFWSFTPDSIDGIIIKLKEDPDHVQSIAAAIMAALVFDLGVKEVDDEFLNWYYEEVVSNCYPIEFNKYVNDDLIDLYNDDVLVDEVWNALSFRSNLSKAERWKPDESGCHDNFPNNDAANMIMWAQRKGYSAQDLIRMAKEAS
ncbi:MAG: hypothetical protein MJZ30_11485 [Paludibacteraceae bacterium]|nr:hypothetical protein [Paludibacteraceae bacterium]